MMNRINCFMLLSSVLLAEAVFAAPLATWHNGAGRKVLVYGIPQQATEASIDALIQELKELPSTGVGQLVVDDVSETMLAKINDGFATLCGKQLWSEIDLPVTYADARVVERVSILVRELARASAMDFIEGTVDLDAIYQQYGFTEQQAKTFKDRYQSLFVAARQQANQMLGQIGNRAMTERETEQIQSFYKKYEQCFIDHFFMIFGATRKALVAEHNALLQEISKYNDGDALKNEYKKICDQFKKEAVWLNDTSAEETISTYTRRCNLLTVQQKKDLEEFKKTSKGQIPDTEVLNVVKMVGIGLPLVAVRAVHGIVNAEKPVALFALDPSVQECIEDLLLKAGYIKNAVNNQA